jgi:hypothetical protein
LDEATIGRYKIGIAKVFKIGFPVKAYVIQKLAFGVVVVPVFIVVSKDKSHLAECRGRS